MKKLINLERTFGGHQKLYSRITAILGSSNDAYVSVVNVSVDSNAADIQVFLKFSKTDLPKNFENKSKDILRFRLTLPDFVLIHSENSTDIDDGEIIDISESLIKFALGKYEYSFSSSSIVFSSFETSEYYELADRNYGISLDDLESKL